MNKRLQIILLLLAMFCGVATAQEGLNIGEFFENSRDYAGQTDEVRIKGKSLKPYNLTTFHSITLTGSKKTADIMEQMVRKDSKMAETVKEVTRGNHTIGIYCQLPSETAFDEEKRFILFRRPSDDNAMLVYVEGPTTLDEIVKISFK